MSAPASIQLDPHETCSFDKWILDIKSITPIIKAAHQEIDAQRCLTDDLLSELHNLGLFRLSLPRNLNGGELSPYQLSQVAEVLAQAEASVG